MEGEVCCWQKHNVVFIAAVKNIPPSEQISMLTGSRPCPFLGKVFCLTPQCLSLGRWAPSVAVLEPDAGAHRVTTCTAPQLHLLSSWQLDISGAGAPRKLANSTDLVFSLRGTSLTPSPWASPGPLPMRPESLCSPPGNLGHVQAQAESFQAWVRKLKFSLSWAVRKRGVCLLRLAAWSRIPHFSRVPPTVQQVPR